MFEFLKIVSVVLDILCYLLIIPFVLSIFILGYGACASSMNKLNEVTYLDIWKNGKSFLLECIKDLFKGKK